MNLGYLFSYEVKCKSSYVALGHILDIYIKMEELRPANIFAMPLCYSTGNSTFTNFLSFASIFYQQFQS
jgi:hypothetical protein